MPGRVLERAVYIRSEPLHLVRELLLFRLGLVIRCAGHRSAAGVQLSLLQGEQVLQVSSGGRTQYWSGLLGVASAIRAVADSLRLGATTRCCLLRPLFIFCHLAYRKALARFLSKSSLPAVRPFSGGANTSRRSASS